MNTSRFSRHNLMLSIINNKAFLLMVLVFVVATFASNRFLTVLNLTTMARQISVMAIVATGFTLIFTAGQFDLSVGEVLALSGVVYATATLSLPIPIAMIIAVSIGAACGLINGTLIRVFKLPAFVLTLAIGMVYRGITFLITGGASVFGLPDVVVQIGQGTVLGFVPIPTLIMLVVLAIVAVAMGRTIYGRHLIATGGNVEAARVSGIRINLMQLSVYIIAGICAAIGAIVLTGRQGAAVPNMGDGFALDAIAAVVIGGTAMRGGRSKVIGTLWGVILIAIIGNVLTLLNVSPFYQWIIRGSIIITAIILDNQTDTILNKIRENDAAKQSIQPTKS